MAERVLTSNAKPAENAFQAAPTLEKRKGAWGNAMGGQPRATEA